MRIVVRFLILSAVLTMGAPVYGAQVLGAHASPQSFTYQGRFFNSAGTAPLTETVDITLGIYDPSGTCLLYEEQYGAVDLLMTSGIFSVQVGSDTSTPLKRDANDPNLSMSQVFQNLTVIPPNATFCTTGYTPALGDVRLLRVTVTPTGGGTAMVLPDQPINSAPQAIVAETLQGIPPEGFIQFEGNVTQTNMEELTNPLSDASNLHNHDGRYVRLGTSASQNFGTGNLVTNGNIGIGTSSPTDGLTFGGNQTYDISQTRNDGSILDGLGHPINTGSTLGVIAGGATPNVANQTGGTLDLSSGISTGNQGSNIVFQTASPGSSGSTDNSPTTKMVLTGAGYLGLGTTTPATVLDIGGGTNFVNTANDIINAPTDKIIQLRGAKQSVLNLVSDIDATNGKVGGIVFSRSTAQTDLHVNFAAIEAYQDDSVKCSGLDPTSTCAASSLRFYTNGHSQTTEAMRIDPTGRVGIGVINPTNTLAIGGNMGGSTYALSASSATQYGVIFGTSDAAASSAAAFWVLTTPDAGVTENTLFRVQNNGNVGIGGTVLPSERLHISGNLATSTAYLESSLPVGLIQIQLQVCKILPASSV